MGLLIILGTGLGCFLLGLFAGAKIMQEKYGKDLRKLEAMIDDVLEKTEPVSEAVKQINKSKEKVDARK